MKRDSLPSLVDATVSFGELFIFVFDAIVSQKPIVDVRS